MKNPYTFFVIFTVMILSSLFSNQTNAQTAITAKEDAYVQTGASSALNFGVDTILRVRSSTNPENPRKAYLKFDLSSFTGTFTKAYLRLWPERAVNAATPAGSLIDRIDVYSVFDDIWKESEIKWSNAPAPTVKLTSQEFPRQSSTDPRIKYDIDITSYVTSEFNNDKIVSLCLTDDKTDNNTDIRFYSREAKSKLYPQIILSTGALSIDNNSNSTPNGFAIEQNYPNPFNPETILNYSIPKEGHVNVSIYNMLGQKIVTLFDGIGTAGNHQHRWDGKNDFGQNVNSGVYFAKIDFVNQYKSIKMLLTR